VYTTTPTFLSHLLQQPQKLHPLQVYGKFMHALALFRVLVFTVRFFLPLQHFLTETLRVCQSDDNYFIPVSLGSISLQATSAKYFCGSTQTYIPTLFACFIAAPSCNCQFFGAEDVEESNLVFSAIFAGGAVCAVKS